MSLMAVNAFPAEEGRIIRNTVLFGVLIYELIGPMVTKVVLKKSGDIVPKDALATTVAGDTPVDNDEDD